ncbi:MAG: S-layer homology domain-containing protein, partial [Patescibacteria group bacterium]
SFINFSALEVADSLELDVLNNDLGATSGATVSTIEATKVGDKTPPSAPTSFALALNAAGKVVVTWIDPTDSDLSDVMVLRGKNGIPVSGTPYASVPKGTQTFTDTDVMAGDVVKYILRGKDTANNESDNTAEISITVTAPVAVVVETPVVEEDVPVAEEEAPAEEEAVVDEEGDAVVDEEEVVAEEEEEEPADELVTDLFSDLSETHFAVEAVQRFYDAGVVEGYSDGTIGVGRTANRAEAFAMIFRAAEVEMPASCSSKPYPDVEINRWFCPVAQAAKAMGLAGKGGNFAAGDSITRAEVLVLLANVLEVDVDTYVATSTHSFSDVASTSWQYKYVIWAADQKFVSGFSDGTFKAGKAANRGEILTILDNAL